MVRLCAGAVILSGLVLICALLVTPLQEQAPHSSKSASSAVASRRVVSSTTRVSASNPITAGALSAPPVGNNEGGSIGPVQLARRDPAPEVLVPTASSVAKAGAAAPVLPRVLPLPVDTAAAPLPRLLPSAPQPPPPPRRASGPFRRVALLLMFNSADHLGNLEILERWT